jgi:hypothetical protein
MLKNYQLRNRHNGDIIYQGRFDTLKHCVEFAIGQGIPLNSVDLRKANLSHANLDDAFMNDADLSGANLCGANMSEGHYKGALFRDADLTYVCFNGSRLIDADMIGASFAATDVTDAMIKACLFSCPSIYSCLFHRAECFVDNVYYNDDKRLSMSKPPITINGLLREIVHLDSHIKIGHEFIAKSDLIAAGDRHLEFIYGREVATFIRPVLYENIVNL